MVLTSRSRSDVVAVASLVKNFLNTLDSHRGAALEYQDCVANGMASSECWKSSTCFAS